MGIQLKEVLERISQKPLTKRESEVFQLMLQGYSKKSIPKQLFIVEGTCAVYQRRIYTKCNVSSQVELMAKVIGVLSEEKGNEN